MSAPNPGDWVGVAAVVAVPVGVVSVPVGVAVTLPVGCVVAVASITLKVAVAVVSVSMDSTLTMYWSGLKLAPSTSKDHVLAPSPCWTVVTPATEPKPEASLLVVGWNAAEVTWMFSVSPTARLVVPVIVNLLPAALSPIASMKNPCR
ncbi:MAG: hypothetical protein XD82_1735 [Methanoculleus marisnigri]|uniref:Uncharacterized protein n=1 Tax=Methanoculleus marisnigri TaxID=2198 RepID=A0A101GK61_9EURY|nr:MAG: hypothetical protein XD82_1735 [Methanoculleus marisnigri]